MSITTLENILASNTKLTPMMEQYFQIKMQYPEDFVFFRMGDFYELFFDDAKQIAQILNITLTHRGKLGNFPIAMAGIPHHSAASYLDRLAQEGYRAVICEQLEDPKEVKGIVKRGVSQIVGPGIPFDLDKVDQRDQRYLASAYQFGEQFLLILLEFTSGQFLGMNFESITEFAEALYLYSPREFILFKNQWVDFEVVAHFLKRQDVVKNTIAREYFDPKNVQNAIKKLIPNFQHDKTLQGEKEFLHPIAAMAFYVTSVQQQTTHAHIHPFQLINNQDRLKVSLATLAGLEILPKSKEGYKESLLGLCDHTLSAMGHRELKKQFMSPLRKISLIEARQKQIAFFLEHPQFLEVVRQSFSNMRNFERALTKISTLKAKAPDLLNLAQALKKIEEIIQHPEAIQYPSKSWQDFFKNSFAVCLKQGNQILKTLNSDPEANLEAGNLIQSGFSKRRDQLFSLSQNAEKELSLLEQKYRKESGINNLKIKSNNISGLFIEISKGNIDRAPKKFVRLQTLTNGERYTTPELEKFEKEINSAKEQLLLIEDEIFKNLCQEILQQSALIIQLSEQIAAIDTIQSFAFMAKVEQFTCPKLIPNKKVFSVQGAFHPLIKTLIKDPFTPHDFTLNEESFFALITGPNMAGKTTLMREMCIIQFLAQLGSFVPAKSATLGVCDYLFARLGASDNILHGQSTFMVEMNETAEILRHASEQSFILLDEVGRGTSTYDGLSIAWALVEHFIQKTKCITLFSTHYHELIQLIQKTPHAQNFSMETIVENGEVRFLYRLLSQGAMQSYGLYVAKLAGVPQSILDRASELLISLEDKTKSPIIKKASPQEKRKQLSFFEQEQESAKNSKNKFKKELQAIDINSLTPLQAMLKLSELKNSFLNETKNPQ